MSSPVVKAILEYNAGRDPVMLRRKYRLLRRSPYGFLRGTCHLFYADPVLRADLPPSPVGWLIGDLHASNFGSYKGDTRLPYFDVNDFDEALMGPALWDLVRFVTSILVGVGGEGIDHTARRRLARSAVLSYAAGLASGRPRWLEREVAEGPIRRLLKRVGNRTRRQLLRERTEQQKGIRRLRVDSEHGLRAEPGDRHRIVEALHRFAARQDDPRFYRVRDVARRIAGVGSLGVERYVVLVEGRQPGRNALLDLKAARPSALQRYLPEQPAWKDEAERTVTVQQWLQAAPPPRLAALQVVRRPFVLRELQPSDDRLDLQHWEAGEIGLANTLRTMGALTAWAHLRSGGRRGSAVMDEWMDFGRRREWQRPLLALAEEAARRLLVDWKTYCEAYDAGAVDDHG